MFAHGPDTDDARAGCALPTALRSSADLGDQLRRRLRFMLLIGVIAGTALSRQLPSHRYASAAELSHALAQSVSVEWSVWQVTEWWPARESRRTPVHLTPERTS
jgi:hypothetical protein